MDPAINGADAPIPTAAAARSLRVWDLPTRVCHWLLAAAVIGCIVTGKVGGNALQVHLRLGLLVLALLVFRIVWGFMGGRWSRFSSFVYTPATILAYLRGRLTHARFEVGHSPSGALSVFAMLALLIAQVATGLVADDEIATTGPLYRYASSALSSRATGWHTGWGPWLIAALIVLHVAAIVFYTRVKRKRLLPAMIHGDKEGVGAAVEPSRDGAGTRVLALLVLACGLALAVWIHRQGA